MKLGPDPRGLSSVVSAHAIGIVMAMLSPFIIGALIREVDDGGFGIGEGISGIIVMTELFAIAAATYAIAPYLETYPLRSLAFAGVSVCLIANLASVFIQPGEAEALAVARAVSGLGAGVVFATGSAAAARWSNPDRTYAIMVILGTIISALGLMLIPIATRHFGYLGGFAFILANVLLLTPFLGFLPATRERPESQSAPVQVEGTDSFHWQKNLSTVAMLLGAMLLLNLGDGAIYYFSEGLGERVGANPQEVGFVLTLATVAGLLGASAAAVLNSRFGRVLPLCAALLIKAMASIAIVLISAKMTYAILQQIHAFTIYFTIPYVLGLSALVDRKGRVAAMVGGTILIGSGVSATVGGYIVEHLGYGYLGFLTAFVVVINLMVVVPVAARFDRRHPSAAMAVQRLQ